MTEAVEEEKGRLLEEEEICNEGSTWNKQNQEGKSAERITNNGTDDIRKGANSEGQ